MSLYTTMISDTSAVVVGQRSEITRTVTTGNFLPRQFTQVITMHFTTTTTFVTVSKDPAISTSQSLMSSSTITNSINASGSLGLSMSTTSDANTNVQTFTPSSTTMSKISSDPKSVTSVISASSIDDMSTMSMMTVTTTATASVRPTPTAATSTASSKPMSSLWWIVILAIAGIVIIILLVFIWRKCARKSFDKAGCFIHAVFETTGGMIFGKRWDEWKATRAENRKKRAGVKHRLSKVDDDHARSWLVNQWRQNSENYRRHGKVAKHDHPPSTVNSTNFRHTDKETVFLSPRSRTIEMRQTAAAEHNQKDKSGQGFGFAKADGEIQKQDRTELYKHSGSFEEVPYNPDPGVQAMNSTSPVPLPSEVPLSKYSSLGAPGSSDPSTRDNVSWQDQRSCRDPCASAPLRSPDIRTQVQRDIEATRKAFLCNADADIEAQSITSFRAARSGWAKPPNTPRAAPFSGLTFPPPATIHFPSPANGTSAPSPLADNPLYGRRNPSRPAGSQVRWTDAAAGSTDDCTMLSKSRGENATKDIKLKNPLHSTKDVKKKSAFRPIISSPIPISVSQKLTPQVQDENIISAVPPLRPPPIPTSTLGVPEYHAGFSDLVADNNLSISVAPSGFTRWNALFAARGLKPGLNLDPDPDRASTNDDKMKRNSLTSSFYSDWWEDEHGGRIGYDHLGRIREVEFGSGNVVRLNEERKQDSEAAVVVGQPEQMMEQQQQQNLKNGPNMTGCQWI